MSASGLVSLCSSRIGWKVCVSKQHEMETYHKSPINLPHQRNLHGIRLRLRACIIRMLTFQGAGFEDLLVEELGRLFVLDDGLFGVHLECPTQSIQYQEEFLSRGRTGSVISHSTYCQNVNQTSPYTKLYLRRGSMHPPAPKTFQAFPRTAQRPSYHPEGFRAGLACTLVSSRLWWLTIRQLFCRRIVWPHVFAAWRIWRSGSLGL